MALGKSIRCLSIHGGPEKQAPGTIVDRCGPGESRQLGKVVGKVEQGRGGYGTAWYSKMDLF